MKYLSDVWFIGIAAAFFIVSAISDKVFQTLLNTSIILILFWIGLLCFILYHFIDHKRIIEIITVVAVIGLVVIIAVTSLVHRNVFNFLGWIFICLEIGNILIKTW